MTNAIIRPRRKTSLLLEMISNNNKCNTYECTDRMQKSLNSVVFVYMHLNHVVQRFLIAQSEALSDVQHVNLRAADHDADQSVISCAQTLQTDGKNDNELI